MLETLLCISRGYGMTFKRDWEQAHTHFKIPTTTIESMVEIALPDKDLASHTVIAEGCANLNIKLEFANAPEPVILRIYLRDPKAALREQRIAALLKQTLPIPEVYFVGEQEGYRFAITEYIPGITLRNLLLDYPEQAWAEVMLEAGTLLAHLQTHTFAQSGFLDEDLQIKRPLSSEDLVNFVLHALQTPQAQTSLDLATRSCIEQLFQTQAKNIPNHPPYQLVHGDFDPANILVNQHQGHWSISGILDWEFAYAGSWLNDLANMLRYAHAMPAIFETAFLKSL
ncbi:MAG TPA: aminoglycoside phosphotransferase family protein, partial [Opitutales bacterium]|nr:aminoglycoside phosphotransferase family protein [Opitutales bacterium]